MVHAKNQVPIVQMKNIGKKFGPVRVLENVDFNVYLGEVHVLAGENGAGKSTLIKILSGVHTTYEGEIFYNGQLIHPSSPIDARNIGIAVIHQELSLVPTMSITNNLFMGRALTKGGFIQDSEQKKQAQKILNSLNIDVGAGELIENLPVSVRQLIEIANAVSADAKVIIMDEPSSALNAHDAEILFMLIEKLKKENRGIVYISHRMEEIERLAERITILRDGKLIHTDLASNISIPRLINMMVGREIDNQITREYRTQSNDKKFIVNNFNLVEKIEKKKKLLDNVSFYIRPGEVLGIAGLRGSGASEMMMSIFGGYGLCGAQSMVLNGVPITIKKPQDAINQGIALLTNDRKMTGLVTKMTLCDNVCLADRKKLVKNGWRDIKKEKEATRSQDKLMNFHAKSFDTYVENLSGGNQQKVAFGKWLQTDPQVLMLDEPTKGVDVGAKNEIYQLIDQLTKTGLSILLITSELPELLALSDRIMVLHRGKLIAEFSKEQFSADRILEAEMGRKSEEQ
jgi:ribose transport system ATP-binding protein